MILVWKFRRASLTRAASWYPHAAAASLVGALSWSGQLLGLVAAPLLVYLWGKAECRSRAFLLAFCYYLAAGHGLVAGAGVFFGESPFLPRPIPGLLLWIGYSGVLAAAWGGFWGRDRKSLRLVAALITVSVPPIGIVGGFNPLLAIGAYFPGLGWLGMALMLVWFCALARGTRPFLFTLPFAAVAATANLCYVAPALPSWSALDTSLGPATASGAQYDRLMFLQQSVATWSTSHSPGSVLVLPELVGDDWSLNSEWWKRVDTKLKKRQQTLFIGAYMPYGTGSTYENVIVTLGHNAGPVLRDRVPVPISMWKPWTGEGAMAFWGDSGVQQIGGKRVASLVCYEQLLMWPVIQSLLEKPDVLIAPANDWWANETNLPELQRLSVQAWARAFSIPSIWVTNR